MSWDAESEGGAPAQVLAAAATGCGAARARRHLQSGDRTCRGMQARMRARNSNRRRSAAQPGERAAADCANTKRTRCGYHLRDRT